MASDKEYMREYMKVYSRRRRERILEILGGVCVKCGSTADLHVHHKDPECKSFTLGGRWHRAWSAILEEIKECEVRCEDCHREEHASQAEHGTPQRYWRGCRCRPCTTANSRHSKEYKKSRG